MRFNDKGHREGRWTTYFRSYLLTLATFFVAVPGWVVLRQGGRSGAWPWWSSWLLALLVVTGLILAGIGLFARGRTVERWADKTSPHEASLVMMVLAFPWFVLLRVLQYGEPAPPRPRRNRPPTRKP